MRRKILSLKNIIYGLGRNYEGSGLRRLIQTPRGNAFSVRNNVMFLKEIKLYYH